MQVAGTLRTTGSFNIMIMTLRNSVSGYQHFEVLHSLHLRCHGINRQTHISTDLDEIIANATSYDFLNSISSEKTDNEIIGLKQENYIS